MVMALDGLLSSIVSSQILTGLVALTAILIGIILPTVLQQVFFKNPNEPPVVFHWFPVIGSTVTYGIDPYKFYFDCQSKVSAPYKICGTESS